jgi:hypothetical protein
MCCSDDVLFVYVILNFLVFVNVDCMQMGQGASVSSSLGFAHGCGQ